MEFSDNINLEKLSRRQRAKILGVQSVVGSLSMGQFREDPNPADIPFAPHVNTPLLTGEVFPIGDHTDL